MSAFEKNTFTDALKDKLPDDQVPTGKEGHATTPTPGSTPHEVAEEARRQAESLDHGRDRDDQLINMGRGRQTTGR